MNGVEVNPNEIPEELKEREQWLLWDSSADTPRRPHWKGNFGVSWNDPEDWHSFAEALAAVEKNGSWGLGYVVARENDDHAAGLYGCLDLDGCAVDGSPKDWLPDLTPFFDRDAYVEFSPSKHDPDADKHGIRIPIKGFSPPDWWTDVSVPDADHEGVEAEGSKFQTFTGDTLRGAGEEVAEHGEWLDEWLMDAYEAVTGDTAPPRREEQQGSVTDYEREQNPHDGDAGTGSAEDIMRSLDRLNAQRVAEDTIVHTWNDGASTSDGFRAFIPTWAGASCNGTANIVDGDKWVDTGGSGRGGPAVMAAIAMGEVDPENAPQRDVEGSLWWDAVEYLRDELGYDLPEPEGRGAAPSVAELIVKYSDEYDDPEQVPEHVVDGHSAPQAATDGGAAAAGPDDPDGDGNATSEQWNPAGVIDMAFLDDYGRFQLPLGDDEDRPTVHDLRTGEKARYVWDLMEKTGRGDVLATDDDRYLALDQGNVWADDGEQRLREHARETLRAAYKAGTLEQLKDETHGRHRVAREDLGTPWRTVAVGNGLLDLETRNLMELEPEHYAIRQLPEEYDPDAEAERFDEFITEVVPDPHERRKLQEYAGYTLLKDEQPMGKALFLVGPKNSGKSTFLKVLREVLGDENVAAQSLKSLVDTRWGIAQLQGTFANMRNEVTPGGITQVETFKELTGGGNMLDAERKGEQKFKVEVTQKFLFATNEMPDVQKVDDAFIERLMFVRFPETVPPRRQENDLGEKLLEEREGILNWMLEGLARFLERGEFTRERDDGEKRELLDAFGGVLDRFKHRALEITGHEDDVVVKDDLYKMANQFADLVGKEPEWSDKGTFTKMLKQEPGVDDGQVRNFGGRPTVYRGIRVKEDPKRAYDGELREEAGGPDGDETADERDGSEQTSFD